VTPPDHRSSQTAVEAIREALARHAARFMDNEEDLRRTGGEHAVHQMRVAVRRIRSDLDTYRPLLAGGWHRTLRRRLKPLAEALGTVRDLDVRRALVADHAARLGGAPALVERLDRERGMARMQLAPALSGPAYISLLREVVQAPLQPVRRRSSRSVREVMVPLAIAAWQMVRSEADALPNPPGAEQLHHLRITAKRVRYALHALDDAVPESGALRHAVADLQEGLGRHHDLSLEQAWLAHQADRPAGLDAVVDAELERAGAAAMRAWHRAAAPELRHWMLP
jgi:CHAD domain-containing protein